MGSRRHCVARNKMCHTVFARGVHEDHVLQALASQRHRSLRKIPRNKGLTKKTSRNAKNKEKRQAITGHRACLYKCTKEDKWREEGKIMYTDGVRSTTKSSKISHFHVNNEQRNIIDYINVFINKTITKSRVKVANIRLNVSTTAIKTMTAGPRRRPFALTRTI